MNENILINSALLLSVVTYLGYQLKAVPGLIWEFIKRKLTFTVTIEETNELYIYIERWLKKHHEANYRNVEAILGEKVVYDEHVNEISDDEEVKDNINYYHFDDFFIIRFNRKRLVVTKGREKLEAAKSLREAYFNRFTIEGWRAKKVISELLEEVVEYNQQFKSETVTKVYVYSYGHWQQQGELDVKSIDKVFFADKQRLLDDLETFKNSKEWYLDKGVMYKRGYIFSGEPGNGKTATALALGQYLKKDIYILSLSALSGDSELTDAFRNLKPNSLLVMEDIDAAFLGGSRDSETKITFSALLNCLDGVFSKNDVITIMTTNHIEKLDPALIRAGRIDMKVEISNPSTDEVIKYVSNFFDVDAVDLGKYKSGSKPMVDVQNVCLLHKTNINEVIKQLKL